MTLPKDATLINIPNSTVEFFKYSKNDLTYIFFDTSSFAPPEPMINAMAGLKALENENYRLIMINHKLPLGLFPKIETDFEFTYEEFDEFVKIEFKLKNHIPINTDFDDNFCGG